jgi:hypothetical protein
VRKRVSVTMLRKKYPHPVRALQASGYSDEEYCVGGAFCKEMGIDRKGCNFPTANEIRAAVEKANPNLEHYLMRELDADRFDSLVDKLVACNDIGNFKEAWLVLGTLLRWKPKLKTFEEFIGTADDAD